MRGALGTIIKCFKRGTSAAAAAGARIQRERVQLGCVVKMSECRLIVWLLLVREDSLPVKCHEISSADVTR